MVDNLVENSSNQNDLNLKHLNHHLSHSQMSKLITGDSDNTSGIDNRLKIVQNVSVFSFSILGLLVYSEFPPLPSSLRLSDYKNREK